MSRCHQVLLPHAAGLLSAALPCFSYDEDNRQNILFFSFDFVSFCLNLIWHVFLNHPLHTFERRPKKSMQSYGNWSRVRVPKVPMAAQRNGESFPSERRIDHRRVSTQITGLDDCQDGWSAEIADPVGCFTVAYHRAQLGASSLRMSPRQGSEEEQSSHLLLLCSKMAAHIDALFPTLIRVLGDSSDEVNIRLRCVVLQHQWVVFQTSAYPIKVMSLCPWFACFIYQSLHIEALGGSFPMIKHLLTLRFFFFPFLCTQSSSSSATATYSPLLARKKSNKQQHQYTTEVRMGQGVFLEPSARWIDWSVSALFLHWVIDISLENTYSVLLISYWIDLLPMFFAHPTFNGSSDWKCRSLRTFSRQFCWFCKSLRWSPRPIEQMPKGITRITSRSSSASWWISFVLIEHCWSRVDPSLFGSSTVIQFERWIDRFF